MRTCCALFFKRFDILKMAILKRIYFLNADFFFLRKISFYILSLPQIDECFFIYWFFEIVLCIAFLFSHINTKLNLKKKFIKFSFREFSPQQLCEFQASIKLLFFSQKSPLLNSARVTVEFECLSYTHLAFKLE